MKILLHICCAPCTIYPLEVLRKETGRIEGLFFNPNIHPYLEYRKRLETLREFAKHESFAVEEAGDYPMEDFLRKTSFMGPERCSYCYEVRLRRTAAQARKGLFDAFTTTLLFSRYQKHDLIRQTGEAIAREMKVPFYYQDFRAGWEEGNRRSRESGMYRQKYCGCLFSEKERFYKEK